jgi:hypothetical protein
VVDVAVVRQPPAELYAQVARVLGRDGAEREASIRKDGEGEIDGAVVRHLVVRGADDDPGRRGLRGRPVSGVVRAFDDADREHQALVQGDAGKTHAFYARRHVVDQAGAGAVVGEVDGDGSAREHLFDFMQQGEQDAELVELPFHGVSSCLVGWEVRAVPRGLLDRGSPVNVRIAPFSPIS